MIILDFSVSVKLFSMWALVIAKSKYMTSLLSDVIACLELGGGVCIYLRKYINYTTCVNYSSSICELLILKLQSPSLIIIIMYRPPSCAINEFEDIIDAVNFFFVFTTS